MNFRQSQMRIHTSYKVKYDMFDTFELVTKVERVPTLSTLSKVGEAFDFLLKVLSTKLKARPHWQQSRTRRIRCVLGIY